MLNHAVAVRCLGARGLIIQCAIIAGPYSRQASDAQAGLDDRQTQGKAAFERKHECIAALFWL